MLLKIYENNINSKHIEQITECLLDGGVIIYPTDTLYGFGCNIFKPKAVERIAGIKGIDLKDNKFSIICSDLKHLSDYARPIDNHHFRIIKRCLPGPFTFLMDANNNVPKQLHRKKKQVGIRVPDNTIALKLVEELGNPILSTSVPYDKDEIENTTNPEYIYDIFKDKIDIMIDASYGDIIPSTVVDFSSGDIEIIREGKGDINLIY